MLQNVPVYQKPPTSHELLKNPLPQPLGSWSNLCPPMRSLRQNTDIGEPPTSRPTEQWGTLTSVQAYPRKAGCLPAALSALPGALPAWCCRRPSPMMQSVFPLRRKAGTQIPRERGPSDEPSHRALKADSRTFLRGHFEKGKS